ncbi:phosphotransferase family protein [Rossellomorea vietnamensis]|uniref:phosphotransferase family protein n=1 Tax=Rossellomorea vietnamensis TaxID=218284 RepID=UPI003CECD735
MKHQYQRLHKKGLVLKNTKMIKGAHAGYIYRVTAESEYGRQYSFVYKEFAKGRENEIEIMEMASHYISPFSKMNKIWSDSPPAILMEDLGRPVKTTFSKGTLPEKELTIKRIVERLAELHSLETSHIDKRFPVYRITAESLEWCSDQLTVLHSHVNWVERQWVKDIKNAYERLGLIDYIAQCPLVFTHGDPHLENIFYHDEQMWFIDWEWAAMTSPLRDFTIMLQDLYDPYLIDYAETYYKEQLRKNNLILDMESYQQDFCHFYIDHTTMMIAWEVEKYFQGLHSEEEIKKILLFKADEISRAAYNPMERNLKKD